MTRVCAVLLIIAVVAYLAWAWRRATVIIKRRRREFYAKIVRTHYSTMMDEMMKKEKET